MEGVAVLSTETIMCSCTTMGIISNILIGCLILGVLILITGLILENFKAITTGGGLIAGSILISLCSIPIDLATQIPNYNTYEVIVDDTVSMKDFTNTYEILEQRGEIYVVKEIDNGI